MCFYVFIYSLFLPTEKSLSARMIVSKALSLVTVSRLGDVTCSWASRTCLSAGEVHLRTHSAAYIRSHLSIPHSLGRSVVFIMYATPPPKKEKNGGGRPNLHIFIFIHLCIHFNRLLPPALVFQLVAEVPSSLSS